MLATPLTLNAGGRLLDLSHPMVMGILNVTPDSFYADSRCQETSTIVARARQILEEGGSIIDIGACSTRPGFQEIPIEDEIQRLRSAIRVIRQEVPEALLSVDTYRADVARICVEEEGVHIINDISGGQMDKEMFRTVARLGVPYVLTHLQESLGTSASTLSEENFLHDLFLYFAQRIQQLREMGAKDILLDPGFGFGKSLAQNYELMAHLENFKEFGLPLLVGVSRKSMIYRLLNTTPEEALNGTTALHAIALEKGAHLLRVHDVKAAVETIRIHHQLHR